MVDPSDAVTRLAAALADRYSLDRELGGGGMSRVFLARERGLNRDVVIKVLSTDVAAGVSLERFEREIHLAASLQQANIVPLLSAGEVGGVPYYSMPFVPGESLRGRLAQDPPLDVRTTVGILRDVARALSYAHARGVVHRDIKPDNVLLSHGTAVVTDFGIAKAVSASRTLADGTILTQAGVSLGTPAYMAPEQISGEPGMDHRVDIYAWGCLAYEMLVGQPPFSGDSPQRLLAAHLTEAPRALGARRQDLPPALARLVMHCLEKDPAARPGSAEEVLGALEALPASGAQALGEVTRSTPSSPSRRQKVAIGVGVLILLSVVATLLSRSGDPGPGAPGTRPAHSIAVLPFVNMGGDPENEYFSDGLTEELIAALSRLRSIRVAARTSVFALKGDRRDVREIGRALNVEAVLEGSVRRQGDQVRVAARLVSVADGFQLWSATYEREMTDILAIESDLAFRITTALEAELTPADSARLVRKPTESVEAHTLYLKGQYFWHRRTRPEFEKALDYFQQALALDPAYALAYAGLANTYGPLGVFGYIPPPTARARMREAAYQAVQLDGGLAETHTSLAAYLNIHEWDVAETEREFLRAIELNPNYSTAHHWYGYFLVAAGRFEESLAQQRIAVDLDPLAPIHTSHLALALLAIGQPDQAVARYHEALDLAPGFWLAHEGLGLLYEALGEPEEAVRAFENAVTHAGPTWRPRAGLARTLALVGRTGEARRLADTLVLEGTRSGIFTPEVATALYALGDTAAAFAWLEDAYRQRHPDLQHTGVQAGASGLEKTTHFAELMQRVGFPAIDWAAAARGGR